MEIIDLSQEIFDGMSVFHSLPPVKMEIHATHEQWDGLTDEEIKRQVYINWN
jgi:kynurenine formamidase